MIEKIFTEDIDIPEIVLDKAEAAFAEIKRERLYDKNKADKKQKHSFFKNRAAAAAACVAILGAGGLTAYAAVNHFWSEGLKEEVTATDTQREALENAGAVTYLDTADTVTTDGITIRPMETLVDGHYAVVTFEVTGVDEELKGSNLLFESFTVDIDDGIVGGYSGSGGFYEEPIITADGKEALEYVLSVTAVREELSGKKLSVAFNGLGTAGEKAEIGEKISDGTWKFDLVLSGAVKAVTYEPDTPIDDLPFTVESVRVSSLTVKIDYSVNGEVTYGSMDDLPLLYGLKLKDGTVLDDIFGAGGYGFTDETMAAAYEDCSLTRVIDPEDVEEVILFTQSGTGNVNEQTGYPEITDTADSQPEMAGEGIEKTFYSVKLQ